MFELKFDLDNKISEVILQQTDYEKIENISKIRGLSINGALNIVLLSTGTDIKHLNLNTKIIKL